MLTRFLSALTLLLLMFSIMGCGNGTTTVGNSSESISVPTITIGQLIDGASTIEMSLGVFGADESALDGASFDIKVNGVQRNTNLDPFDFFISSSQLIQFRISPLKDGDELEFVINASTGVTTTYSGVVSDAESTLAVSDAVDLSSSSTDNPFGIEAPVNLQPNIKMSMTADFNIVLTIDADSLGSSQAEINSTQIKIKSGDIEDESFGSMDYAAVEHYDAARNVVEIEFDPSQLDCTSNNPSPNYAENCGAYVFIIVEHEDGTIEWQTLLIGGFDPSITTISYMPFHSLPDDSVYTFYELRPQLDQLSLESDCDAYFSSIDSAEFFSDSTVKPQSESDILDMLDNDSQYVLLALYSESGIADVYTEGNIALFFDLEAVLQLSGNIISTFSYLEIADSDESFAYSLVINVESETDFTLSAEVALRNENTTCTINYTMVPKN